MEADRFHAAFQPVLPALATAGPMQAAMQAMQAAMQVVAMQAAMHASNAGCYAGNAGTCVETSVGVTRRCYAGYAGYAARALVMCYCVLHAYRASVPVKQDRTGLFVRKQDRTRQDTAPAPTNRTGQQPAVGRTGQQDNHVLCQALLVYRLYRYLDTGYTDLVYRLYRPGIQCIQTRYTGYTGHPVYSVYRVYRLVYRCEHGVVYRLDTGIQIALWS